MLSDEELQALAEKLAPLVNPKKEEPKKEKEEKPKDTSDGSNLAEQIAEILDQKTKESSKEMYENLWEDKINTMFSNTRGLEDFLKEEDDYGIVRIDRLKEMPYKDRLETAKKLESQFRNALSNGAGKAPRVDAKTQELAEDNEKRYNGIEDKLKSNEYESVSQMQAEYFDAMSSEFDSIIGN